MTLAEMVATWSPGPIYLAAQPYILAVFGAVLSVLLTWLCAILQRRTNIVVDQAARDRIQTAAMNAAGRIMAAGDDRIARMQVPIHSELIRDQIPVVTDLVKGAVDQMGLSPDHVGEIIQGKLGQLQAVAQGGAPTLPVATAKVSS